MAWSRSDLAEKGFFYIEDIRSHRGPVALYPPHVEALRASMLDFSCAVLGTKHYYDESGHLQLELEHTEWQNPRIDTVLIAAKRTQNEAKRLYDGGYAEKEWDTFFHTQFLAPLRDITSALETNSRRISRSNYYYDYFTMASDELWTEFKGNFKSYEMEKCPKPDRACYLPMYSLDAGSHPIPKVTNPDARQWHQFVNPSLVETFSWPVLKELFRHGLRPTPFRVFENPPLEASLRCYPWLIVEHKRQKKENSTSSNETDVCCQATNAAACAIQLNINAASYAVELKEKAHIPPIPAVTTIGSRVKVWIMHYAEDFYAPAPDYYLSEFTRWKKFRQGYVMRAIWEGDMTKLNDIIQFQLILENTHTWAMRVFKPLMASYIEQWRFVHCQAGISMAATAMMHREQMMERCRITMPLVQSYLENQSTIELDDRTHSRVTPLMMGFLFQQLYASQHQTLTDKIERIITEQLKGLRLNFSANQVISNTQHTSQSKRTSLVSNAQDTESLGLPPEYDDPNDSDYEDSQPARPDVSHADNNDEFRRGTRSSAQKSDVANTSPSLLARQVLVNDETPVRERDGLATLTPLSGTTASPDSVASTPTGKKATDLKSVSATETVTSTTKRLQTLEIMSSTTSPAETKPAPKSSLFGTPERRWPERWPTGTRFPSLKDQKPLPLPTQPINPAPKDFLFFFGDSTSRTSLFDQAAKASTKSSIFSAETRTDTGQFFPTPPGPTAKIPPRDAFYSGTTSDGETALKPNSSSPRGEEKEVLDPPKSGNIRGDQTRSPEAQDADES